MVKVSAREKDIEFCEFISSKFKIVEGELWMKYEREGWKVQSGIFHSRYFQVSFRYRGRSVQMRKHRLIWFLYYGEFPKGILDHINRDTKDNRIANLRDSDSSLNLLNRTPETKKLNGCSSQFIGVYLSRGKYVSRIKIKRKMIFLGSYSTQLEAVKARDEYILRNKLTNRYSLQLSPEVQTETVKDPSVSP